jgi:hypothetical protein
MKSTVLVWFLAVFHAAAAGLDFPSKSLEATPKPDADEVVFDFPFTNKSGKHLIIREVVPNCSCLKSSIKGGKMAYAPGEQGVLRATMDITNLSGDVEKAAAVFLNDDPDTKPSSLITMRAHVPVLVEVSPKTARWNLGEKPGPKVVRITMHHDKPIRLLSVNTGKDLFRHQLKTIEDGKRYELEITPTDTSKADLQVFTLVTDCDIKRHKNAQAFADVFKPLQALRPLKP